MVIRSKTIYKCDRCGKETEEADIIVQRLVPGFYIDGMGKVPAIVSRDLCPSCFSGLCTMVKDGFAEFTDGEGT